MNELKPCPFCGGEAIIITGEECAYVQCLEVKMHKALWYDGDNAAADEVAEQWNRRADLPPTPAQIRSDPRIKAMVSALKDARELAHGVSFSDSQLVASWGDHVEQKVNAALAAIKEPKP